MRRAVSLGDEDTEDDEDDEEDEYESEEGDEGEDGACLVALTACRTVGWLISFCALTNGCQAPR